ncbi:hypothetical protein B0H13DRAFT_2673353 [Mycena leptocephala]|nr:hypothetical protein B0H13DRAFT_2673353 [Mycena leptocephala]
MDTSAPAFSLNDLPVELLLEMIQYLTYSFDFLCPLLHQSPIQQDDRRQALGSLSQSCSVLREVSLPFLWERVDLSRPNFQANCVAALIFPYIKSVHISMLKWSLAEAEAVPLFVKFLGALPNLLSLRIYQVPPSIAPILCSAFADMSFPLVNSLSIQEEIHAILPRFPNITMLACRMIFPNSRVLTLAKAYLPRLEALVGLRIQDTAVLTKEAFVEVLVRNFPQLRAVSIGNPLPCDSERIERHEYRIRPVEERELAQAGEPTEACQNSLCRAGISTRASRARDAKVLRVWSSDGLAGPCLVHEERC